VSKQFKKFFLNSPETIREVMQEAENEIVQYWKQNVYSYFNARSSHGLANTGQLGRSLVVKIIGNRLEFSMLPMHNPRTQTITFFRPPSFGGAMKFSPFSMPSMGMGIKKDYDYGELLRNGFSQSSQGRYSFEKDCKVKPGTHPGYDAETRWVPWKKDFDDMARQILVDKMLKRLKLAGVADVRDWKVDINI
jgi:hypothetical protein